MQDGIHPPKGRVDLYEKRCPSVDLPAHEQDSNTWCTSYGQVDVSRVVHRLNKLGTPIWEDEYNKNENVLIQRPFHDNIGVGKIVCLFCDNSMDATYQLPAWHTWKDLLVPIFESIVADSTSRLFLSKLHSDSAVLTRRESAIAVAPSGPMLLAPKLCTRGRDINSQS